ncbi:MAG: 3-methylcrotonyl-CoA carboxylase, partial [Xenophilus sp.]
VEYAANGAYRIDGEIASIRDGAQGLRCVVGSRQFDADVVADETGTLHVFIVGAHVQLARIDKLAHAGDEAEIHGGLVAPMPGKIIAVIASGGAQVDKGAPLLVMEAMKMEYAINAPANGTVTKLLCKVGDLVAEKAPLVEFEAES